jgi:hypothetical protein
MRMARDRYLELILTIIALELLWLGVKDTATVVAAQAAATRVVIAGIEVDTAGGRLPFVPVGIAGSFPNVPPAAAFALRPLTARVEGEVTVQSRRPLKVEADKPLPVLNAGYVPSPAPGE